MENLDASKWGSRLAEQLTEQFYAWERRGRGWQTWQTPIELEPPFRPFERYLPAARTVADDGRIPSIWERAASGLGSLLKPKQSPAYLDKLDAPPEPEPLPSPAVAGQPTELQIVLETGSRVSRDAMAQFLLTVSSCRQPVAFELVGLTD
jgi:hypothetical protein